MLFSRLVLGAVLLLPALKKAPLLLQVLLFPNWHGVEFRSRHAQDLVEVLIGEVLLC